MSDAYEAMVYSAHLPNRTVAFIYKDGEPPLAGGIYRIERIRNVCDDDRKDFTSPVIGAPVSICPLCDRLEEDF